MLLKVSVHICARAFAAEVYIPGSMVTGALVEEGEILSLSQVLNNLIMLCFGIIFFVFLDLGFIDICSMDLPKLEMFWSLFLFPFLFSESSFICIGLFI